MMMRTKKTGKTVWTRMRKWIKADDCYSAVRVSENRPVKGDFYNYNVAILLHTKLLTVEARTWATTRIYFELYSKAVTVSKR